MEWSSRKGHYPFRVEYIMKNYYTLHVIQSI